MITTKNFIFEENSESSLEKISNELSFVKKSVAFQKTLRDAGFLLKTNVTVHLVPGFYAANESCLFFRLGSNEGVTPAPKWALTPRAIKFNMFLCCNRQVAATVKIRSI